MAMAANMNAWLPYFPSWCAEPAPWIAASERAREARGARAAADAATRLRHAVIHKSNPIANIIRAVGTWALGTRSAPSAVTPWAATLTAAASISEAIFAPACY